MIAGTFRLSPYAKDRIKELTESLRAAQVELVQVRSTCKTRMDELNAECGRLQTLCEQHIISKTQLQSEKDVLHEQLGKLKEQFGNAETRVEKLVRQISEDQDHWTTERLNLTSRVVSHMVISASSLNESCDKRDCRFYPTISS